MTFLRPDAWVLLTLAIPLTLLHLYFRRRVVVRVAAVRIWQDIGGAGVGRRGFRRLREGASLAVLLLALLAVTAALAEPVSGRAAPAPEGLVIVLDGSVSMNTRAGAGTRFDLARGAALEALDRLGPEDDVTVWVAREAPLVAVSPTTDHAAARAAIVRLEPTLAEARLPLTVALARRAVALAERTAALLVISDAPGAASLPPDAGADVVVAVDQGRVPADAAIERVENYRWDPSEPVGTAEVVVRHRAGEPLPRRVVVVVDDRAGGGVGRGGAEVGAAPVTPSVAGPVRVVVPVPNDVDGVLHVRLEPADDFRENDVSGLVVRRAPPLRLVVTAPDAKPSPYLVEALAVLDGLVDVAATLVTTPDAPASVLAMADLVVAEGPLPASRPAGTPLLAFSEVAGETVAWPTIWGAGPAGEEHPVLRGVDLSPLRIDRAAVRPPGDGETRLADSPAGALAFAAEAAADGSGARRVLFGFRPDASTLPLEAAFPLLVRNALLWLRAGPSLPGAVGAGDPLPAARAAARWADEVPRSEAGALLLAPAAAREGTVARVPRPRRGASRLLAVATPSGVGETYVRWDRPEAARLSIDDGGTFPGVPGDLADRRGVRDTRRRWAPRLAALAAALLLLGTLLLPRRSGARPARRGPSSSAPPSEPSSRSARAPVGSLTLDGSIELPASVR